MTPTTFLASADPIRHTRLAAGFVATLIEELPVLDGLQQSDLADAAAGFIDCLAVTLSCMSTSHTPAGRRALAQGVAVELDQAIATILSDPERSACLQAFMREGVQ